MLFAKTLSSFKVIFCCDRSLEHAPAARRLKLTKAECLALLGRYAEAEEMAKYVCQYFHLRIIFFQFINSHFDFTVTFSDQIKQMRMPFWSEVCAFIIKTISNGRSFTSNRFCSWLQTMLKLVISSELVKHCPLIFVLFCLLIMFVYSIAESKITKNQERRRQRSFQGRAISRSP